MRVLLHWEHRAAAAVFETWRAHGRQQRRMEEVCGSIIARMMSGALARAFDAWKSPGNVFVVQKRVDALACLHFMHRVVVLFQHRVSQDRWCLLVTSFRDWRRLLLLCLRLNVRRGALQWRLGYNFLLAHFSIWAGWAREAQRMQGMQIVGAVRRRFALVLMLLHGFEIRESC